MGRPHCPRGVFTPAAEDVHELQWADLVDESPDVDVGYALCTSTVDRYDRYDRYDRER